MSKKKAPTAGRGCKGKRILRDTNGDGIPDRKLLDTNCDGKINMIVADKDQDGHPDYALIDSNGDGKTDIKIIPRPKGGPLNVWLIDRDGDKKPDVIGYDDNANGKPDRYKVIDRIARK